jgi:hypothetical protein
MHVLFGFNPIAGFCKSPLPPSHFLMRFYVKNLPFDGSHLGFLIDKGKNTNFLEGHLQRILTKEQFHHECGLGEVA